MRQPRETKTPPVRERNSVVRQLAESLRELAEQLAGCAGALQAMKTPETPAGRTTAP
jgi:hypothetical protein